MNPTRHHQTHPHRSAEEAGRTVTTVIHDTTRPSRLHATLQAISAAVQAGVVVGGVPLVLWRTVGWPLPHTIPTVTAMRLAFELRDFSDRLLIGGLATAVWVVWALTLMSLATHLVRALRHINLQPPRIVPAGLHRFVGKWIGSITVLVALATKPALATTPGQTTTTTISSAASSGPAGAATPFVTRPTLSAGARLPATTTPAAATTARSYRIGPRDSLWSIAEATLGDGSRWTDILAANRDLITDPDILPDGLTLTIPTTTAASTSAGSTAPAPAPTPTLVTVEPGDNMWVISRDALQHDARVSITNRQIVPYWAEVVELNEPLIRSHDADLIYPGEHLELPTLPAANPAPTKPDITPAPPNPEAPASSEPTNPSTAPSTLPAVTLPTATVPVSSRPEPASTTPAADTTGDDGHYSALRAPWLYGLGLTGISAAAILAALAAKRRRQARTHTATDPIPVVTAAERNLITQLRAIAEPGRITAVDRTLRYLWAQAATSGKLPDVTIIRAGRHGVELLAANAQANCPPGFVLLDDATIVVDPDIPDDDITAVLDVSFPLCPALVTVGSDDIGDILIDTERLGAVSIEADTPEHATAVLVAIAIEQAGLPWANDNTIITIGLPDTINALPRITPVDNVDRLVDRYAKIIAARTNHEREQGFHRARLDGIEIWPPTLILIGPGHDDHARQLAELAVQSASGLAVIAAAALPASNWRLVVTQQHGELEPNGINLATIRMNLTHLEPDAVEQTVALIAEPASRPTTHTAEIDDRYAGSGSVEAPRNGRFGDGNDSGDDRDPSEMPDRYGHGVSDDDDDDREETDAGSFYLPAFEELVTSGDGAGHPKPDEPSDEPESPAEGVVEVIARIMEREDVELVLLDAAPRLEGVKWKGNTAARADEVVAFLALHGPSSPREIGEALWPAKRNTSQQVSQAVSRARSLLGDHSGQPRLTAATRSTPYSLAHIGCDWHRFQQLTVAAQHRNTTDATTLLAAALELVRATPFAGRREGSFEWAADLGYELEICMAITSAAERLAEHALSAGDADTALRATEKGRLAVAHHQALYRLRMRAHDLNGDTDAVRQEYEAAQQATQHEDGLLAQLEPETRALFASVLAKTT